ncbi:hypothetical protein GCM10027185_17570 [Spirosoma pulveris]
MRVTDKLIQTGVCKPEGLNIHEQDTEQGNTPQYIERSDAFRLGNRMNGRDKRTGLL